VNKVVYLHVLTHRIELGDGNELSRLYSFIDLNPLMGTGNHSATSNNMKLVHLPLMGGLLHLVQQ